MSAVAAPRLSIPASSSSHNLNLTSHSSSTANTPNNATNFSSPNHQFASQRNLAVEPQNHGRNSSSGFLAAPSGLTSSTSASPLNSLANHHGHTGSFSTSQSSHNLNALHRANNPSCAS